LLPSTPVTSPDSIDRVTPTMEPDAQVVIRQDWHHLLFLHWEVPPAELQALLPAGLDLDTFEGKAYVGLVPFTLTGVRPILTPPLPWISSFHEINVRTYVHRNGRDPGVWFFSLDASSAIAVAAARAAYKLPYFHAHIDFDAGPAIRFDSKRDGTAPVHAHIRYAPAETPAARAAVNSLEFFLVERYLLYAVDEHHDLYRARVHHQPYPLQRAELHSLDETLVWAAGIRKQEEPQHRHYAREVNVKIYLLERV
jgi:uncharacterized protein YqjF (DUF2071 family)